MSNEEGPFYVTNISSGPPMPPYGTPERVRYDAAQAAAGLVGHPEPTPDRRRAKSEERWDIAVDWLINCNECADPDIQTRFWALVDGDVTRDRVDQADLTRLRAKVAKRNGDTP